MNNDDRCKNIKPRDDFCYKVIDDNTSFDFLIDYEPIRVFYNEAILNTVESIIPANLQKYKDLIQINAYHTAVAFQSNSYAFTIDLICPTGMSATLSPTITNNHLIWNNKNQLTYNDANSVISGTNIPYWDHSTYITTITKNNFMDLLKDIKEYLDKYPIYALFNVVNSRKIDLLHPELNGLTCDSFAYFVLNKLQKHGSKINLMTHPKSNIVAYVADSIRLLDFSNARDKKQIIDFYNNYNTVYSEILKAIKSISITNILILINAIHAHISEILNHTFIYYCYGKDGKLNYYELKLNSTQQLIVAYTYGLLKNDINPNSIFDDHHKHKVNYNVKSNPKDNPKDNAKDNAKDNHNSVCPKSISSTSIIFIVISIILSILLIFGFIYHNRNKMN
jgi:hypothetical protein